MPAAAPDKSLRVKSGTEDFSEFIRKGYYYVDKTSFIKPVLEDENDRLLLLRPRRFGKTLMMSTLKCFLELDRQNPGDTSKQQQLFDGLDVAKDRECCAKYMGRHPVISVSLKSAGGETFLSAYRNLAGAIYDLAVSFKWIEDTPDIADEDKDVFARIRNYEFIRDPGASDYIVKSLAMLCRLLHQHFGDDHRPVLLIDEYDVPLQKAALNGYYRQMSDVVSPMLSNALKTNEHLEKGILTGCLKATKEGIFTGLNNLTVNTPLNNDDSFSEAFGFTPQEVKDMLAYYGLGNFYERIKTSYDGYRIGSKEIFCPWDVTCYVKDLQRQREGGPGALEPPAYWNNTSSSQIITRQMPYLKSGDADKIEALLEGKNAEVKIEEGMTYGDLKPGNPGQFWNLLVYTGYLTVAKRGTLNVHEFRIPNAEIMQCFRDNIAAYYGDDGEGPYSDAVKNFVNALISGNGPKAAKILGKLLQGFVSVRDEAVKSLPENFYQGFINGLFAAAVSDGFVSDYRSNRESGDGYPDALFMAGDDDTGVALELKQSKDREKLRQLAMDACDQIKAKDYARELREDGAAKIFACGIAFCKRQCAVSITEL